MRRCLLPLSLLLSMLSGCGSSNSVSSSDGHSKEKIVTFNAQVVDGYIKDAKVCLDSNLNGVCESSEPTATTSTTGAFGFTNINTTSGTYLSFIASSGTDTATDKAFLGELKSVVPVDSISSSTNAYLTPLTDLIATGFINLSVKSSAKYNDIKSLVANAYTIDNSFVDKNPLSYSGVYARSQEVVQTLRLLKEASLIAEGVKLTLLQEQRLQKDVKDALVKQIMTTGKLDVNKTMGYLESTRGSSFTTHEKTYLDAQLREIKLSIDAFVATKNLTGANLKNYQIALESKADTIYAAMQSMDVNSTIPVVPVDINITEILAISLENNETNSSLPDAGVKPTTPVDSTSIVSFNGYLVDGYISGATLCMDFNYNGTCDASEPKVNSQKNGAYQFSDIEVKKGSVIPVIATDGVDTATGITRASQLQNVVDTSSLGVLNLTPLTDYIAVSFAQESNKSSEVFQNTLTSLQSAFGVSSAEIQTDSMQNVSIFALSEELEYTRRILEKVFALPLTTSFQNEIKKELLVQILKSGYNTLSISQVITTLEIALSTPISDEKRDFAVRQIAEIHRLLDLMKASTDIQTYTLSTLQVMFESSISNAITTLTYSDINLSVEDVSYSDFSKTDAIYDVQACVADTQYTNTLSDSNTTSTSNIGFSEDTTNGLLLNSSASEITLYYETLGTALVGSKTTEFLNDNNYFAFDEVWRTSAKHIYMRLAKNGSNKYTCYRINLGSTITKTKVFRYASH